jgi:hypothetical protein
MKKRIACLKTKIGFVVLLSLCSVVILSSCKKDEHFDGTTWTGSYNDGESQGTLTLRFTGSTVSIEDKWYDIYEGDNGTDTKSGMVKYDKPTITITADGKMWATGTVSKKTMTLNVWGITVTLTKVS